MFEPTDAIDFARAPSSYQLPADQALPKHRRNGRLQHLGELFGACDSMRALFETIRRVSAADATVVVLGESGSGKELVARAIHRISNRKACPFVPVNCGALADTLIDSELFGHERGSFTGAARTHRGCFERANGGTLFLDEITEMRPDMQVKLLRALESGRFSRVGGDGEITTDVRIIAATNRDLRAAVSAGKLREDLLYRLNVFPIHVPPLRERAGDIAELAEHFLGKSCALEGMTGKRLTPEALALLAEYRWPGNVRELRNLMERAAILVDGEEVRAEDLAVWLEGPAAEEGVGLRGEIERRESDAIRRALEGADWNVTQAAAGLGIDRTNLHRKMRKYGIARR